MKRKYLYTVILFVFYNCINVTVKSQTTINEAQNIAYIFFQKLNDNLRLKSSSSQIRISDIEVSNQIEGQKLNVFLCQHGNSLVIVGGTETNPKIYGYTENAPNILSDIPPSLKRMIENYSKYEIEQTENNTKKYSKEITPISPLLGDIEWGQGLYYQGSPSIDWNYYCPVDSSTLLYFHKSVGCVPVALGMIMKYHEFPANPMGEYEYTQQPYGTLGINFDTVAYDFTKMAPAEPTLESARFLRQIGLACHALDYTSLLNVQEEVSGSADDITLGTAVYPEKALEAMKNNFGYRINANFSPVNQADSVYDNILENLEDSLPVILGLKNDDDSTAIGHAVVVDGIDGSGLLHYNFGWEGTANGYYSLLKAEAGINGNFSLSYVLTDIKPVRNKKIPQQIEPIMGSEDISFEWDSSEPQKNVLKYFLDTIPNSYNRFLKTSGLRFSSKDAIVLKRGGIMASSINLYGYGADLGMAIVPESKGKPDIDNAYLYKEIPISPSKSKLQHITFSLDDITIPDSTTFYVLFAPNADVAIFNDFLPKPEKLIVSDSILTWNTINVNQIPIFYLETELASPVESTTDDMNNKIYNVYRKSINGYNFKKIASVKNTSFSDSSAKTGEEYYYYITSFDTITNEESNPSKYVVGRVLKENETLPQSDFKKQSIEIDGKMTNGEWDINKYIELAKVGESSKKLYVQNDNDSVYFCLEHINKPYYDNYSKITFFHDNDNNGEWKLTRPYTEGAMQFYFHPEGYLGDFEADWFRIRGDEDYSVQQDYPSINCSRSIDSLISTYHEWAMPLSYFYPATTGDTIGISLDVESFFGLNYLFTGNNTKELTIPDFSTFIDLVLAKEPMEGPVAIFNTDATSGYVSVNIQFTDNSSGTISSWSWDFGDGTTSTEQNPSHTYTKAGTFSVSLTVTGDGGTDTETKTDLIVISETILCPIAGFSCDTTSGFVPLTILFTDTSKNSISSWSWDFGDGTSSTEQNPSHIYSSAGTYTVSLIIEGEGGADTITVNNLITASVVQTSLRNINTDTPIQIYPNPSKNSFNIELQNNPSSEILYEVYNNTGQRILSQTSLDNSWIIDMQEQSKGIYIVKIYYNDKTLSRKIILE